MAPKDAQQKNCRAILRAMHIAAKMQDVFDCLVDNPKRRAAVKMEGLLSKAYDDEVTRACK